MEVVAVDVGEVDVGAVDVVAAAPGATVGPLVAADSESLPPHPAVNVNAAMATSGRQEEGRTSTGPVSSVAPLRRRSGAQLHGRDEGGGRSPRPAVSPGQAWNFARCSARS